MESAKKACELTAYKNPDYLETLAAACAEAGDFDGAIKWEKKALESPEFEKAAGDRVRARLKTYQAMEPFRLEK